YREAQAGGQPHGAQQIRAVNGSQDASWRGAQDGGGLALFRVDSGEHGDQRAHDQGQCDDGLGQGDQHTGLAQRRIDGVDGNQKPIVTDETPMGSMMKVSKNRWPRASMGCLASRVMISDMSIAAIRVMIVASRAIFSECSSAWAAVVPPAKPEPEDVTSNR